MEETCLSDHAVSELARGALVGAELQAAEDHIATCDDCRVLVSELARATPFPASSGGSGRPLATSDPPPAASRIAGKYRVEGVLGAGGMGVVVSAWHELLNERVAIKLPKGELRDDPEARARLIREARAAAKLRSEHVARVLDVGTLDDGSPFIVMEHLVGRTLAARLDADGPLPAADAIAFALDACAALEEAHAHGVIHRDLKPANLFETTRFDGTRTLKVLDFGIAKTVGLGPTTKSGALVGSPRYMSPEQLKDTKRVDARTDVWAMGATLFELLTGRPAFDGAALSDICAAIARGEAPSLRAVRPDAPAWLDRVVARCMQHDPAKRFPSATALAAALRHRRSRAPLWIALAVAVAVAAIGVAVLLRR